MVKVSQEKKQPLKECNYKKQFSQEIFKVAQRFRMQSMAMYKIKDFSKELIKGTFY